MWTKVITKLPLPKIRPSILYFICIFILFWGYIYMCFLQFNTIVMLVNILWIIIIKTMQFKEIVKHNKTSAKSSAFIYYKAIIWERWSYLSTQFATYLSPYSYKHNKEKFFFPSSWYTNVSNTWHVSFYQSKTFYTYMYTRMFDQLQEDLQQQKM